ELAVQRSLILAPAEDLGPVADAPAARVIERHLDDQLRTQGDPLELSLALPAARVAVAAVSGFVRGQLADQRALLGRLEPRGVADDVQLSGIVVQAEDQRADRVGLLARPPAGHDRVDRPHALDLHHAGALAGAVGGVAVLGHHALAAAQPRLGLLGVA